MPLVAILYVELDTKDMADQLLFVPTSRRHRTDWIERQLTAGL
jgi:hypothetical protein